MAYPPVVVVNEQNEVIGSAMLAEVWEKGLYHRVATIFIEDEHGNILLQRRAPHMLLFPNRWDNSVGGHVDEGKTYDETATIEIEEEVGLKGQHPTELGTYLHTGEFEGRIMNQFVRVYALRLPRGTVFTPELAELAELRWFTPAELKAEIAKEPKQFTDGVLDELRKFYPHTVT